MSSIPLPHNDIFINMDGKETKYKYIIIIIILALLGLGYFSIEDITELIVQLVELLK